MKSKFVKLFGYPSFFFAAFSVSLYLTFPMQAVKGKVVAVMEDALGKGKQGRYGTDPRVSFESMDLWRLSGVSFERLSLQLGSKDPDPGTVFDFDELRLRVGLLSLLSESPEVSFDAEQYDGELEGDVTVSAKGNLKKLNIDIEDVNVARMPVVVGAVGVPTTGKLKGNIEVNLGKKPSKEAKGSVDLTIAGLSLGPGELEVPIPGMAGGLTVPSIDMGDLKLKTEMKGGKTEEGLMSLNGKDFQAELKPALFMNDRLNRTRLTGDGWFAISEQFLKDNSKFETLLSFAAPLKTAKDKEGKYHFALKGTVGNPSAKLSRPKKASKVSKKRPRKRPKKRPRKATKSAKKKPKLKPKSRPKPKSSAKPAKPAAKPDKAVADAEPEPEPEPDTEPEPELDTEPEPEPEETEETEGGEESEDED